jgi:hypothetical protein
VAEQPRLDVIRLQRPGQQRVPHRVDPPNGQVVGRPPVGVDRLQFGAGQRLMLGDRGLVQEVPFCVCSSLALLILHFGAAERYGL